MAMRPRRRNYIEFVIEMPCPPFTPSGLQVGSTPGSRVVSIPGIRILCCPFSAILSTVFGVTLRKAWRFNYKFYVVQDAYISLELINLYVCM